MRETHSQNVKTQLGSPRLRKPDRPVSTLESFSTNSGVNKSRRHCKGVAQSSRHRTGKRGLGEGHSGWGLGLEHRGLGPHAVLSLMAPGLHTRRDGFPTARQALGHHRVWGAVTWRCWISLSTAALRVALTLAGDLQRKGPLRGQPLRLSCSLTLQV